MPTDEQREKFERWYAREGSAQIRPFPAWTDHSGYGHHLINEMWRAWAAADTARDAEMKRLVAALTGMVVAFDPSSEIEVAAHQNAVMLLAEHLPELGSEHAD